MLHRLWPTHINDLCRGGKYHIGTQDGFFFNSYSFYHYAARAHDASVFDDDRGCLYRFQNTAYAYSSTKMDIFANLGTGPYRGPGVYHGAFVYICPYIYVRRHHNNSFGKERTITGQSMRNNPHTQLLEIGFKRYLVMENKGTGLYFLHLPGRKVKNNGFLDPVVYMPGIQYGFSYT